MATGKHFIVGAITCFAVAAISVAAPAGELNPSLMAKIRELVEKSAREEFDFAQRSSVEETQRRVREGLPPLTKQQRDKGNSALQFVLYNKAYNNFICAQKAGERVSNGDWNAVLTECANARHRHFLKYIKMTDDPAALDLQKIRKCQIKTRDYDGEQAFPPYDFIKDRESAMLFDFEAMNRCILDSL